jgi:hypothetical protein
METIAHSDKHINIKRKRRYQMFLEEPISDTLIIEYGGHDIILEEPTSYTLIIYR